MIPLTITPILALSDNYIWAIQQQNDVIIVDPSEFQPVADFIKLHSLNLTAILLTHNHHDHVGGVDELLIAYPDIPVYGPTEVSEVATNILSAEEHIQLFGYDIRIIESAGHTEQHISYLFGNKYLFCGDSLFSAGCGRVFTGNYQAQFDALQRFKALPESVIVYPAHEYTQSNIFFARSVMPENKELAQYQKQVDQLSAEQKPTLPTSIALELKINPFLQAENLENFIALRKQKDNF